MLQSHMHRVFFDANTAGRDTSGRHVYWLTLPLSEKDLALIPDKRDGMRIILHDPEELELEAELFHDPRGFWTGAPIPGTIRLLDSSTQA